MATIPHVVANTAAKAAEQNALIDQVNTNTSGLGTTNNTLTSYGTRITTLENKPSGGSNAGAYFGQWGDDNAGTDGAKISGAGGNLINDIDYAVGTPVGCSMRAGTFTANQAGVWLLSISVQYGRYDQVRALWAASGTALSNPTTAKLGLIAGPAMDAQTTSLVTRLSAGAKLSIYAAVWNNGQDITVYRSHGNNVTAVWLGP